MRLRSYIHHVPKALPAVLLGMLLVCLSACSLATTRWLEDDNDVEQPKSEDVPYYDGDGFVQSGGRYRYESDGVVFQKTGVDVSDHQDEIDWGSVAADGIDFAMIRIGYRGSTEGGLYADESFDSNLEDAHAVGIECGVYFFSQATSAQEAKEEAEFVLSLLSGRQLEYPVAFDYELTEKSRISGIGVQAASEMARTFCETISAGGYTPMIYGNTFDLARFDRETLSDLPIWCAEYDDGPSYEHKTAIWQYTNQGYVNGIGGIVDLNLDLSDVGV